MTIGRVVAALVCLCLAGPATAQNLARATPESVGLSSAGLERATAALQAHINAADIAGVVAAVARHGKLVYFEALGQRDREQGDPMPEDAIFRLYSMTRSITSTAGMVLQARRPDLDVSAAVRRPASVHGRRRAGYEPDPRAIGRHHGASPADPHIRYRQP